MTTKNLFTRLTSLLLVIVFLSLALASCKEKTDTTIGESTTAPEETTVAFTDPIELAFIENGTTQFTLVKPIGASDTLLDIIINFRDTFKTKTGITLDLEYEDQDEAVNDDFEILIGKTLRPESIEKLSGLRSKDIFYGIVGNKLVITGGTDDAVAKAVDRFVRNILDAASDKKNITLTLENNLYDLGSYYIESMKIGDTDLSNFSIVYADKDHYAAEVFAKRLQETIRSKAGFTLPVITDDNPATANEIVIGTTNRGGPARTPKTYSIKYDAGKLYMACDYSEGYQTLYQDVVSNMFTGNRNVVINAESNSEKDLTAIFKNGSENVFTKTGVRLLFNNIQIQYHEC